MPTTSNNPTADRDVSYVDITVSWQGASTISIRHRFPAASTCIDSTGATVSEVSAPGSDAAVTTMNLRCSFVRTGTTPSEKYSIRVRQTDTGSGRFDYSVDFKVDGETVPQFSGVMKAVEGSAFPESTAGDRAFRFRNDDGNGNFAGEVTFTQITPPPNGALLYLLVSGGANALVHLTVLKSPTTIHGFSSCRTSPNPNTAVTPDTMPFIRCTPYPVANTGETQYLFVAEITDNGSATTDAITVTTAVDGTVVTPGFGNPAQTANFPPFVQFYQFRIDSLDGPVVSSPGDIPFFFKAETTSTDALELVLTTVPAGAGCVSGGPVTSDGTNPITAFIYCENYVAGDYVFTATLAGGTAQPIYDFFYDNALVSDLSDDATLAFAASRAFTFTAPAARGDPLTMTGGAAFINP